MLHPIKAQIYFRLIQALSRVLIPTENSTSQGLSDFPVLFKADLLFNKGLYIQLPFEPV